MHPTMMITFAGRTQSLGEWAAEAGVAKSTIRRRLGLGWPIEQALGGLVHDGLTTANPAEYQIWRSMGRRPPDMEIDRIDSNRGYEPGNCRWATRKQNQRNRRVTTFVEWEGHRVPLAELAERFNVDVSGVHGRLRIGWDLRRALSEPGLRPYGSKS